MKDMAEYLQCLMLLVEEQQNIYIQLRVQLFIFGVKMKLNIIRFVMLHHIIHTFWSFSEKYIRITTLHAKPKQ